MLFDTMLEDIKVNNGKVTEVITSRGTLPVGLLFIVGEGSGYAGGIISSAADGIKAAVGVAED